MNQFRHPVDLMRRQRVLRNRLDKRNSSVRICKDEIDAYRTKGEACTCSSPRVHSHSGPRTSSSDSSIHSLPLRRSDYIGQHHTLHKSTGCVVSESLLRTKRGWEGEAFERLPLTSKDRNTEWKATSSLP